MPDSNVDIPQPIQSVMTGPPIPRGLTPIQAPEQAAALPPGLTPIGERPTDIQGAAPSAPKPDMQQVDVMGTGSDLAQGVTTHAAQSLAAAGRAGSHIPGLEYVSEKIGDILGLPKLAGSDPYKTVQSSTAHNADESENTVMGAGGGLLEGVGEWVLGEEALKGLSLGEKMHEVAKVTKILEAHPKIAQAVIQAKQLKALVAAGKIARTAASGAVVGGIQGSLHTEPGQEAEGAGAGALGGALGAGAGEAIGEGVGAIRGAVKGGAKAVTEGAGILKPGVEEIAGEKIPVRATGRVAKAAEDVMSDAQKSRLQDMEINRTQPAARRAIGNVASDVTPGEIGGEIPTAPAKNFQDRAQQFRDISQPVFKKLDELTEADGKGNRFSDFQQKEQMARRSGDFDKLQAARDAQEAIFDKHKPEFEANDFDNAKNNWRRSGALDDIHDGFNAKSVVKPTDVKFRPVDSPDPGHIDGKGLATKILQFSQDGTFEEAGLKASHVQSLQNLAGLLEKQSVKFNQVTSTLSARLTRAAIAGMAGASTHGLTGALIGTSGELAAEGATALGKMGVGSVLSRIMTSEPAVKVLENGLEHGTTSGLVSKLYQMLWKDVSGELRIPGTGTVGSAEGAAADTAHFAQAKKELPNGTFSDWAKRAQELKSKAAGMADDVVNAARPKKGTEDKSGIKYKTDPDSNWQHTIRTNDAEGKKIGELVAQNTGTSKSGEVTVRSNQIYGEANRGQGKGKAQLKALFDNVAKDDSVKRIKSDMSTTGAARGTWESMARDYPDAVSKKLIGKDQIPQWTLNMDDYREALKDKVTLNEAEPVRLPTPEEREPAQMVSERNPTALKRTADPLQEKLPIGLDAIKGTSAGGEDDMVPHMAKIVANYPGSPITEEEAAADPEKALEKFVNHLSNNLIWLHNQIPENIRNISKLWYDSAHVITKNIAKQYDLTHEQVAASVAALSPKNEWNNNVELAKRMISTYKTKQGFSYSPEMERVALDISEGNKKIAGLLGKIRGKKLSELKTPPEKAAWIRLYDDAYNQSAKSSYAPDGSIRDFARNTDGSVSKKAWGTGLGPMAKVVSIMEDGSIENIHDSLGVAHKIRNFYNNIVNPWDKSAVTIDTHAVGAAHIRPMSQETEEVMHNFGAGFAPDAAKPHLGSSVRTNPGKDSVHGVSGTYGLYAEAYRRAAAKLGVLPRELQSITWEGIRSLYEAKDKTPELTKTINKIWEDHTENGLSIGRARAQIVKAAGGFKDPEWLANIKKADAAAGK